MDKQQLVQEEEVKSMMGAYSSYMRSLTSGKIDAIKRAADPVSNHSWVFAAAMAISQTASQAPYRMYVEKQESTDKRRDDAHRLKRMFYNKCGRNRKAMKRYGELSVQKRFVETRLEIDDEHPLTVLLDNPNPIQNGSQFMQYTIMLLALDGECFWMHSDMLGESAVGVPQQLWPIRGDHMKPIHENRWEETGPLIGWEFYPPKHHPLASSTGKVYDLTLDSVTQFKTANPNDPVRGISRIAAVAGQIHMDILQDQVQHELSSQNNVPAGLLTTDASLDVPQTEEMLQKWHARFGNRGPDSSRFQRKVGILHSGMKFQEIALSPADAQFLESHKWNKNQILAVMGTPDSVLGYAESQTYATQQGQDKNFWDKTVITYLRLIENTIDKSTLFTSVDDRFVGLFDLTNVESLRAGLADKINMAKSMCTAELHMPPEHAYKLVGLEVPEYEGIGEALITPMLDTVANIRQSVDDNGTGAPDVTDAVSDDEQAGDEAASDKSLSSYKRARLLMENM